MSRNKSELTDIQILYLTELEHKYRMLEMLQNNKINENYKRSDLAHYINSEINSLNNCIASLKSSFITNCYECDKFFNKSLQTDHNHEYRRK